MVRIAVISSCTAEKTVECPNPLTLEDLADPARRRGRQQELQSFACAAADLYAGDQHRYVMTAIGLLRNRFGADAVRLWIVSAGYGLVTERQQLIPYEATFNTMSAREIRSWSQHLGLSQAVLRLVGADHWHDESSAAPTITRRAGRRSVQCRRASGRDRKSTPHRPQPVPAGAVGRGAPDDGRWPERQLPQLLRGDDVQRRVQPVWSASDWL